MSQNLTAIKLRENGPLASQISPGIKEAAFNTFNIHQLLLYTFAALFEWISEDSHTAWAYLNLSVISSTSKATRGIFSSCEWDPSFLQVISQQFSKFPWQVTDAGFKFLDEKRHCDSYVSCTRIQPYYPPKTQTQGVLNEVFTFSILFRFHNHINHQYIYSPTSIYIFSILISIYISWGADKENLLIIENFFSWWSFLLFSSP